MITMSIRRRKGESLYEGLKIYISGPITGTDDYKERFAAAEEHLRSLGAIPMNPAVLSPGFTWEEYMHICIPMLDVCDAAYFLEGYRDSSGATAEFLNAYSKGKRLLYQETDQFWRKDDGNH